MWNALLLSSYLYESTSMFYPSMEYLALASGDVNEPTSPLQQCTGYAMLKIIFLGHVFVQV